VLARALRLFHTVRHLRPVQVTGRLAMRLRRVRPRTGLAPSVRSVGRIWSLSPWRAPSMLSPTRFRFLNEEREVGSADDWNCADWPRLWVYNLHYFDDLDARSANDRSAWHEPLIKRWIAENPPPVGAGWEPYCLSLRIVNWCRWGWSGKTLPPEAVHSLAVQARALMDQIEVHLLGNHLFANAKALIFAGLYFEGTEAERWLATGTRYLLAELKEQVLADGGHFERSPMYHAIIANDVIELLEAHELSRGGLSSEAISNLRQAGEAMLTWAETMAHPDGDIAFFNDAAFDIAPTAEQLRARGDAMGISRTESASLLRHLCPSGYVRAESGPAVLIADVGEVGPAYLPGHAHADTLSFELSLNRRRFLVNLGTSEYVGDRRLYERGSASHNTVVVDGADSSEVWSSFRVARRAKPFAVTSRAEAGAIVLSASHDGYRRLSGRSDHNRTWTLSADGLTIEDSVTGYPRSAEAWFHFHPDIGVKAVEGGFQLSVDGSAVATVEFDHGAASIVQGLWAPEFGRLEPNRALRVGFAGGRLFSRWRWVDPEQKPRSPR